MPNENADLVQLEQDRDRLKQLKSWGHLSKVELSVPELTEIYTRLVRAQEINLFSQGQQNIFQ